MDGLIPCACPIFQEIGHDPTQICPSKGFKSTAKAEERRGKGGILEVNPVYLSSPDDLFN